MTRRLPLQPSWVGLVAWCVLAPRTGTVYVRPQWFDGRPLEAKLARW
jgi:hypothetical protein